jgi:hypothetical protein
VPRPVPADAPPGPRAVLVTRMPGDILGPQIDGEQRSGSLLFDAPLDLPTDSLAARFHDQVTVVVDAAAAAAQPAQHQPASLAAAH